MVTVAVTFSKQVGGSTAVSLKESFIEVGANVIDADFREMMSDITTERFKHLYETVSGRKKLFAHAKLKAKAFLKGVDCLALSGNASMVDPQLFNKLRPEGESYDFSRTLSEMALLHVALQMGMPVVGICGGHQVMAVYEGGEIRDLTCSQLKKQRFRTYNEIKVYHETLLAAIFCKDLDRRNENKDSEVSVAEFYGSHTQVVAELGSGYVLTAIANDDESIEAAEKAHGAPTLSTQFHPEVGVKGLAGDKFFYQRGEEDGEFNIQLFHYMKKAGEAYRHKKALVVSLKTSKAEKNTTSRVFREIDKGKVVRKMPAVSTTHNVDNQLGFFMRTIISDEYTEEKLKKLKSNLSTGLVDAQGCFFASKTEKQACPAVILRDIPARPIVRERRIF